ncbi:amino acid/amide ABC transporter membrane protein 2 (HAAT family) [Shimia isoporae]|uniref:Amino acid/amide ABC transporter membrane protein 2 (HAAT family) n=1 Tax=Shimia isoporae TaxID=647720 RepID=A0A4R1NNT3_9RHOB|nr:branched-chain amino acid ABC transporter permease [Shimia isoporae]TCL09491.1 amino acid/amide ABC transporter membrane protein 2 (HAAT family) [Shimia isoporae]
MDDLRKSWLLHLGVLALLLALHFVLPAYHQGNLARIMVLATFAMGYNILFGYTGLLSLGHALFFAAGMYGMGLSMVHLGVPAGVSVGFGLIAGLVVAATLGSLALRTEGVGFMIVTLMFAQAGYLTILYFGQLTRGDEGFVIHQAERVFLWLDLSDPSTRYFGAFSVFSVTFLTLFVVARSSFGQVLVAIRENEERTVMLGYNVRRYKLVALLLSAGISAVAGAVYGVLFGYVGATFASVQYSIFPLLWVLLGGAGTVLGPFIGTLFMFYLIDLSSGFTSAYMLIAGVVLVVLTLFAPRGIVGTMRQRFWKWIP